MEMQNLQLLVDDLTDDQITALEMVLQPKKYLDPPPETKLLVEKAIGKKFTKRKHRLDPGPFFSLTPFKSRTGFIAPGENLVELIRKDREYLDSCSLSYEQVVELLSGLINPQKDIRIRLSPGYPYEISIQAYGGYQYCPFCLFNPHLSSVSYSGYPKTDRDYTIKHIKTNKEIFFSGLLPHMILKHHFFEGGVKYRLVPQDVVNFFKLPGLPEFPYSWD